MVIRGLFGVNMCLTSENVAFTALKHVTQPYIIIPEINFKPNSIVSIFSNNPTSESFNVAHSRTLMHFIFSMMSYKGHTGCTNSSLNEYTYWAKQIKYQHIEHILEAY